MQTFLPYSDYIKSAQVLDYRRLGKQRVECKQIFNACVNKHYKEKAGWINHPAVIMWYGYEYQLLIYMETMILEWIKRGYKNTMVVPWKEYNEKADIFKTAKSPPWIGMNAFHASHRSNLLRKDPVYYGQFNWIEPNNLEYVWPVISKMN